MPNSVVLDIDDRGRISVGKLFGSVKRVIATTTDSGQVLLTPALVVPTAMPSIVLNTPLLAAINESLSVEAATVPFRRRTKPLA